MSSISKTYIRETQCTNKKKPSECSKIKKGDIPSLQSCPVHPSLHSQV